MRLRTLLLSGLAVMALASCGGSDENVVEIRMLDNSFAPNVVEVEVGQTIRFVNEGRNPHNAIAADDSFTTLTSDGGNQEAGDIAEITIDEPGVYEYYCSLHATQNADGEWEGMVGTIIVGGAADPSTLIGEDSDAPSAWSGTTRSVPENYPTIQSAVDAAEPGDLVLVSPGIYREAVTVTTPGLVIRGTDRNEVILDGELTRTNGIAVTADGVAIENMTARGYTVNGFYWDGVTGYRGSYLTAIDDWVYGIYAFDSVDGLFEHSYASGSYDAGFYVGQCDPCNAVVTDVVAEYNGLGYSGTNSSGNMWIVNSEWRNNVVGVVPNTLDSELLPPAHDVVVAGNYIHDNGEDEMAPNRALEWSGFGNGVLLAGVRDSVVRNNLIVNNATSGVQIITMIDANVWPSGGNRVTDNVIAGSGRSDLALGGPVEQGSCFADNEADTTIPYTLGLLHNCAGFNLPLWYGLATTSETMGRVAQVNHGQNTILEHGDAPDPNLDFEQLPGGIDAPVVPAVNVFASLGFDPESITTPEMPSGLSIDARRPVFLGVAVDGGFWPVFMGALVWWTPLAVWIIGGLWSFWRVWRSNRGVPAKVVWTLVVLFIPAIGVVLFAAFGNRKRRLIPRLGIALGGTVLWLGAVVAALLVGGVL